MKKLLFTLIALGALLIISAESRAECTPVNGSDIDNRVVVCLGTKNGQPWEMLIKKYRAGKLDDMVFLYADEFKGKDSEKFMRAWKILKSGGARESEL